MAFGCACARRWGSARHPQPLRLLLSVRGFGAGPRAALASREHNSACARLAMTGTARLSLPGLLCWGCSGALSEWGLGRMEALPSRSTGAREPLQPQQRGMAQSQPGSVPWHRVLALFPVPGTVFPTFGKASGSCVLSSQACWGVDLGGGSFLPSHFEREA